jgi:hypothetical protein
MTDFARQHRLWDFRARGNIWKILPAGGRLIVGEERDTREKKVSFFCVDLNDGRVRWNEKPTAGNWWTGLEAVHHGVVFIHEYPDPSMPDHKKIFALDAATGEPLWENGELAFAFARGSSVFASRELFDRREYSELDLMTGSFVRILPPGELTAAGAVPEQAWGMEVELPVAADEPPEAVRAAFSPGTELEPGESLRRDGMEISNLYEVRPAEGTRRMLREHLFALDARTGAILHRDVVCDTLSARAGTTFFRAEERVLYVKDRTTLRSFSIPAGGVP